MNSNEKIVIFDWGGVVESHFNDEYNYLNLKIDTIKRLSKDKYEDKTIIKKWTECNYDEQDKCISEQKNDEEILNWFENIKLKFNLDCNYGEFYKVYCEKGNKVKYYKDVVDFAHSLKNKCKIGILSNLGKFDKERIDKHYNLSKFDYVWLSYELECKKPQEKIYKIVEEECKISPENILFIEDTLENIEIAEKRNWNVCQATGRELDKIKESVNSFLNN